MRINRGVTSSAVALAALALLAGCAAGTTDEPTTGGVVAFMVPGNTGDGGFLDQSANGVREGADEAGWQANIIEVGPEPAKWQPALADLANSDADLIVTGSFSVLDVVEQASLEYPDKNFVLFDAAVNPENCNGCANVHSIVYRSAEAGFLAGVLAGTLEVADDVERIAQTGVVGVVGGQDIPVINDYIEGFRRGVAVIAPEVEVLSAYAGSFVDPVKGKAVADDMIAQGAEVLFTVAGATDNGVFEAAEDANVWAIGNARSQVEAATGGFSSVLAAADTDVTSSLAEAVRLAATGDLPFGEISSYGVSEGAISLVPSAAYTDVIPEPVGARVQELIDSIVAGDFDAALGRDS